MAKGENVLVEKEGVLNGCVQIMKTFYECIEEAKKGFCKLEKLSEARSSNLSERVNERARSWPDISVRGVEPARHVVKGRGAV